MLKSVLFICASLLVALTAQADKPGAPVKIEAAIPVSLKAGQQGEVVITLVPLTSVDQLSVAFRSEAGLILHSPASHVFATPAAGAPLTQRLSVLAAHDGRFDISVIVTTESAGRSSARVTSVPVVVGDSAQLEKPHAKAALRTDATGEKIKSLPAIESTH